MRASRPVRVACCLALAACAGSVARGGEAQEDKDAERVRAFIRQLKDNDPIVRTGAARALTRIGPAAVPELIEVLKDENSNMHWEAARTLGRIGPAAKDAVPALIEALKDKDRNVRSPPPPPCGKSARRRRRPCPNSSRR